MSNRTHARAQSQHSGIDLPDAVIETARAGLEPCPIVGVPDFVAYIAGLSPEHNEAALIGWCPHCRFPHRAWVPLSHSEHGIDLLRWPGVQCHAPRSRRRPSRVYRLALSLDRPPADLLAAADMPITELFIAYRNAKQADDPPGSGIFFDDFGPSDVTFAARALLKAGVADERAAILEIDGGLPRHAARKAAVKEYISGFPGSTRARIVRATRAALEGARQ